MLRFGIAAGASQRIKPTDRRRHAETLTQPLNTNNQANPPPPPDPHLYANSRSILRTALYIQPKHPGPSRVHVEHVPCWIHRVQHAGNDSVDRTRSCRPNAASNEARRRRYEIRGLRRLTFLIRAIGCAVQSSAGPFVSARGCDVGAPSVSCGGLALFEVLEWVFARPFAIQSRPVLCF